MSAFRKKLVRKLLGRPESFSRNRNFYSYRDPVVLTAARSSRLLRSLYRDLLEPPGCEIRLIRKPEEKFPFILELQWKERRRTVHLLKNEFDMLLEDKRVYRLFDSLGIVI